MTFTQQEINEFSKLINNLHWLFIAKTVNYELLPKEVLKNMVMFGFNKAKAERLPYLAFMFGLLGGYLKDVDLKKLNKRKVNIIISSRKFLPLSPEEKFAINFAEARAVESIKGLGNKVDGDLSNIIIEADQKRRLFMEEKITEEVTEGIRLRRTAGEIVSELGHKTKDWARDLDRIVDFVLHQSYDHGRAFGIIREKGRQASVFKRVHKDACKHCQRLYLKNVDTWEPKVFTVAELLKNGTNIGKKVSEWKPVIGATHPWCRCDLENIPDGFVWSDKDKRFVPSIKGRRDFRKKIKVRVT